MQRTTCCLEHAVLRCALVWCWPVQLRKPILLEGSPGVGKTSLVVALANGVGQELVRINLSEQTDMMDLLGEAAASSL